MTSPDELPGSEAQRQLRRVTAILDRPGRDQSLDELVRILIQLEDTGDESTLAAVTTELGRLARRFQASRDAWMAGYLDACRTRLAIARDQAHLAEADAVDAAARDAVDGAVLMALTHSATPMTLSDLAAATGLDVESIAQSVQRWVRRGDITVHDRDGTTLVSFGGDGPRSDSPPT